jgi:hypothetical protein
MRPCQKTKEAHDTLAVPPCRKPLADVANADWKLFALSPLACHRGQGRRRKKKDKKDSTACMDFCSSRGCRGTTSTCSIRGINFSAVGSGRLPRLLRTPPRVPGPHPLNRMRQAGRRPSRVRSGNFAATWDRVPPMARATARPPQGCEWAFVNGGHSPLAQLALPVPTTLGQSPNTTLDATDGGPPVGKMGSPVLPVLPPICAAPVAPVLVPASVPNWQRGLKPVPPEGVWTIFSSLCPLIATLSTCRVPLRRTLGP